jgi:hypothetical protein
VCCVSEAREEEGHCTGVMYVTSNSVWNVSETTTPSSVSKVIKNCSFVILNVYCAKLILKYIVVDIPIPCTSQNIMSKLQGEKKNFFFPNLLLFK